MRQAKQILQKEMTRQQFLQIMGLGILTIFGIGNLIASLSKQQSQILAETKNPSRSDDSHKFGSRKFGV